MEVSAIFEAFEHAKVLVIGDVMIDQYLSGKVERISPEAPVPVVNLEQEDHRLGGAANVALNIKAMGAEVFLCSVIGDDRSGDQFIELLQNASINPDSLIRSKERRTTLKTRILAANQHLLRVDQEDKTALSKAERDQLVARVEQHLKKDEIKVILFQDYNKGVLSAEVIEAVLSLANELGVSTVVDPKYHNFYNYSEVTLFKPNLKEIRAAVPFSIEPNVSALKEASDYLRNKLNHKHTLITLSEKGVFIDDGAEQKVLPTIPRTIADVCGAGDTVISIAALGIAIELDLTTIAQLANLAGGQVCERVGVVPIDRQQLWREAEEYWS